MQAQFALGNGVPPSAMVNVIVEGSAPGDPTDRMISNLRPLGDTRTSPISPDPSLAEPTLSLYPTSVTVTCDTVPLPPVTEIVAAALSTVGSGPLSWPPLVENTEVPLLLPRHVTVLETVEQLALATPVETISADRIAIPNKRRGKLRTLIPLLQGLPDKSPTSAAEGGAMLTRTQKALLPE